MALTVACDHSRLVTLDEFIDYVHANVDLKDMDSVAAAAPMLRGLANQSSLEPLEQLSSHPHHAVRWAAIQNIGRLSRRAAMPKLEQAVNDPHPHVRRAATNMLQQANLKKSRPE